VMPFVQLLKTRY